MRKTFLCIVAAGSLLVTAGRSPADPTAPATAPAAVVTVHEWGTFTNFAGSDGTYLDFRPLVDNDLPEFVFDRSMEQTLLDRAPLVRANLFSKLQTLSRTRMETPVTYFYTDRPTSVDVRVEFPKGLLTDFYPPVRSMGPARSKDPKAPDPVGNSFLNWGRVILQPASSVPPDSVRVPAIKGESHYAAARETDSALLTFTEPNLATSAQEKFLFYRGIGNPALPVTMAAAGDGRFTVRNAGPDPVRAAILVQIQAAHVRFALLRDLGPQTPASVPAAESSPDQLAAAMVSLLNGEGLYEKESRAMVRTWQQSWFGEDGTRLLYALPRRVTDETLPLHVTPEPSATVRVMIGRVEVMTPEREAAIGTLVGQLGAEPFATREAATKRIRDLGRFAEPALVRVAQSTAKPEVRARAEAMLAELRTGKR